MIGLFRGFIFLTFTQVPSCFEQFGDWQQGIKNLASLVRWAVGSAAYLQFRGARFPL